MRASSRRLDRSPPPADLARWWLRSVAAANQKDLGVIAGRWVGLAARAGYWQAGGASLSDMYGAV
jgi:hypothetical protein